MISYENVQGNIISELMEYTHFRGYSNNLLRFIDKHVENTGTIYRGLRYRKDLLKIGHIYKHDESLSSWSMNKDIAIKFACSDYVPEGYIELLYEDKYGEFLSYNNIDDDVYIALEDEFVHVLLIDENGEGLNVNKHLGEHEYNKEEEIICLGKAWQILNIELIESNKIPYYVLTVSCVNKEN